MHPWVEKRKGQCRFGLQVFALPEDRHATKHVIQAGVLAEALGFDAFFIGDHPGYNTDPWVHLAAIAAQTERIGLGSVVNCVHHRHPAMHGRLAGDLDHISDGRLILGLGIGWNVPEFKQLGLAFPPIPERQAALDEALHIITGMFGSEPISFHGQHWWTEGAHYEHGSIQQPRPPIMIAGAGERGTLRQVARWADACNFGAGRNTGAVRSGDAYRHKLGVLREHCDSLGRPYEDILRSHFTSWVIVAETDEEAKRKLDRYYPDGLNEEQQITRIWGSPERVAAYYREVADAGMEYFVVQVLDATDHETFRLLATEVAPRVQAAGG